MFTMPFFFSAGSDNTPAFFDEMDGTGWTGLNFKIQVVAGPFDGDAIQATNGVTEYTAQTSTGVATNPSRITFDFKLVARGADDPSFLRIWNGSSGAYLNFTAARAALADASRRPYVSGELFATALTVGNEYHFECDYSGGTGTARIYNDALTYDESVTYTPDDGASILDIRTQWQEGDSTGSIIYDNVRIYT